MVNNSAMHGVLFATRNTVRIQGDTLFKDNTGPAIQVNTILMYLSSLLIICVCVCVCVCEKEREREREREGGGGEGLC